MWGHVPKTHPPFSSYGLRQIGQVMPSYVKAWGVGQKSPHGPCVGWVDLYSHSNCKWFGQSMLLFPFPCLGRSSRNNSLTLGHDVRPYARNTLSSWKSKLIHRSFDSNWTSLNVAKMQAALQLWYWISMPFCIAHCCSNSCLACISYCWSYSIFKEWEDNASCWLGSSFPHSKLLIFTFNCSNCCHNLTASHSTFLACDSIVCNCPYNFATYFSPKFGPSL